MIPSTTQNSTTQNISGPPEGATEAPGPEEASADTSASGTCQNCGAVAERAYCPECGQRQATDRFTLWSVLAKALTDLLDLERGTLGTLRALSVRPSSTIRAYWRRRTRPYVSPVRYFLFAIAAFQVVLWQTGGAGRMVEGFLDASRDVEGGLRDITSQGEVLQVFGSYFIAFFAAGVLMLSLISRVASRRTVAEELIFQLYVWGQIALLLALLGSVGHAAALSTLTGGLYAWAVLGATVAWYTWAHVGAHRPDSGHPWWREALEALGTLFLFVVTYTALAGLASGLVIVAFSN